MATHTVTAPARLALLLPWINGDPLPRGQVISGISEFLGACEVAWADAPGGDYVGLEGEPGRPVSDRQLERLRRDLLAVLDGSEESGQPRRATSPPLLPLRSLRFGVSRVRRRPDKLPQRSKKRQEVEGAGAYRVTVTGRLHDVLLYAVMRTLGEPGAVGLVRCPAPAPGDWSRQCGRLFVTGGTRGRPAIYCSTGCRIRDFKARSANAERRK